MINAIVNGLFKLIISLFNTITSPILIAVTSLFPNLHTFFFYIKVFLSEYALPYCSLVVDLLFIPRGVIKFLFDYYIILYSIYLIVITIRFVINIYNKFKF